MLSDCSITYLGDTARLPYGTKSPRTVERYSLACQRFLLEREVEMVLVACNTASANALPALEAASPVPVIGAVEPGALSATRASIREHIGVIGTQATIRSGAYERAIIRRSPGARVTTLACPLLVPLAEEGWTDDDIAEAVARRYLAQLFAGDPDIDTLVLGCTHYPLLRDVLTRTARELAGDARGSVTVVDSATAMAEAALAVTVARSAATAATDEGTPHRSLRMFATDTSRLAQIAPKFLGEPAVTFDLVDL